MDVSDTDADTDTVGSLLAAIATALQDVLRILMFADKRGWGPDEFEQVRVVEDALEDAKRDFQAMAPLVNGQFYYENDRRTESLQELRRLRRLFDDHTQLFRDWIRSGGPINPLWARDTVSLRRQLHRAQCRAARRIFNAEHEAGDGGGSGARCLGAFLVYRRLREHADIRKQLRHGNGMFFQDQGPSSPPITTARAARTTTTIAAATATATAAAAAATPATATSPPLWKQQQPRLVAQDRRRLAGREPFRGRNGYPNAQADDDIEMLAASGTQKTPYGRPPPLATSALKQPHKTPAATTPVPISPITPAALRAAQTTIPLDPDEPPTPPPRPPTLEDLVPDCNAVGTFERFGERDIAFICDFCDGHIVWEDVQRLPTIRIPPALVSGAEVARQTAAGLPSFPSSVPSPSTYARFTKRTPTGSPLPTTATPSGLSRRPSAPRPSSLSSLLPLSSPTSSSMPTQPPPLLGDLDDGNDGEGGYPRWQASTVAMSDASMARTVVFAPLAIANHLPPPPGGWEARLWCPYCDDYVYFDSAEGDTTKYAQDEHGFSSLADFQAHLEWHHTALPRPAMPLPSVPEKCVIM